MKDISRYDFCVFRIPEQGGRVIWEITNACNYSCSYCGFTVDKTKPSDELTTEEVFRALQGLNQNGFNHIKFTGGEPLIRTDMFEILAKANDFGFVSDLSTNASLITPEKARQLAALKLKMVHSSIDGYDKETHESVRGPNTYNRTRNGVRNLVEQGIYVRIGSVIFKDNEYHLREMVESISSLGVDEIIFSYMEPQGKMEGDNSSVSRRSSEELRSEVETLADQYELKISHSFTQSTPDGTGTCPAVSKIVFINNLGQIAPCNWIVEKNPEFWSDISLKTHSFEEVINSGPIRAYREKFGSINGCPVRKK